MGLTGQICSGKSTAAKYLEEKYKAKVINIDKLNKEVLEMEVVKKEIRKNFGDDVYNDKNELNKKKMREIIYSDPTKKRILEGITHGRVFKLLIKNIIWEKLIYRTNYVFIENALLLRFAFFRYICFPIVSVCTTKQAEIIGRVMERDDCDRTTAENILQNQMKFEEFLQQSDYNIINNTEIQDLYKEVDMFMNKINKY
jgi:dephospho-CoA kinase